MSTRRRVREDGSMMSPGAYANPCSKCSGRGSLPHYERWSGGTCYGCSGTGEEPKGGHRTARRPPARTASKRPHPSAAEAKAIADRELKVAAASFEEAEQYEDEVERAAAFYFSVGIALGRSVVDFGRFQRALVRARARVPANDRYFDSFEQGLKAGIKEQAERYEGIEWRGR